MLSNGRITKHIEGKIYIMLEMILEIENLEECKSQIKKILKSPLYKD